MRSFFYRMVETVMTATMLGVITLAFVNERGERYAAARDLTPVAPPHYIILEDMLLMRQRKNVLVIDTRPAEIYSAGHIPGAVNITREGLAARIQEVSPFANIILYGIDDNDENPAMAYNLLARGGISGGMIFKGGWLVWANCDLPVVRHE